MSYMREFNDLSIFDRDAAIFFVYAEMVKYNRVDGWMRWDGDKMRFYDSEVDGGVYIELEEVKTWVGV